MDPAAASAQLFDPPQPSAIGARAQRIASGDFDADGRRDLAVIADGTLSLLHGNGSGRFDGPFIIVSGVEDVGVADFNGDHRDDLLVTFANAVYVAYSGGGFAGLAGTPFITGTVQPAKTAIGDLNGDGRPDVFVHDPGGAQITVFLNQGAGFAPAYLPLGMDGSTVLASSDLNGDGRADLVTALPDGRTFFFYGSDQLSGFSESPDLVTLSGGPVKEIAIADLNADGRPDVVAGGPDSTAVLLNQNGRFTIATAVATPGSSGSIALADFNDDGVADLVYGRSTSEFSVMLGDGHGAFRQPAQYAAAAAATIVRAVDVNGDARADLVAGSPTDVASVILRAAPLQIEAGPDQHVAAAGGNATVNVHASVLSAHTGVTFTWTIGTTPIGTGASLTTTVPAGATILTVTGIAPDGATARDSLTVSTDLSLATQSSVDGLHAKVDQLNTTLTAGLDAIGLRATQASVDALGAILQANLDAKLSSRASSADVQALAAAVQKLQSGATKADLDALATSIAALISGSGDTLLRARIEEALQQNLQTSLYSTPASGGGLLDRVRSIVADVLAHAAAGTDADRAQRLVAEGDAAASAGDYRGAFKKYAEAYRTLNR